MNDVNRNSTGSRVEPPPFESVFEVDYRALGARIDEIPEDVCAVLTLFDGTRTLRNFVDTSSLPVGDALRIFAKLQRDGVIVTATPRSSATLRSADRELRAWLGEPKRAMPRLGLRTIALAMLTGVASMALIVIVARQVVRPPPPVLPAVSTIPSVPMPPAAAPAAASPRPRPIVVPSAPATPTPTPIPIAVPRSHDESLTRRARHELDRGAIDKAAAMARLAIAVDARDAEAQLILGAAEQQRSHNLQARAAYVRYLALSPRGAFATEVRTILRSLR